MIIIARILATVFAIIVLSRSIVDYRNRKESAQMTIFWVVVWLAIAIIAFFPSTVDTAIRLFGGDKTGLGTVFGMGIIFVMFVCYRIYVKANRIEKNLNELTRKFALVSIDPMASQKKTSKSHDPNKRAISSKRK